MSVAENELFRPRQTLLDRLQALCELLILIGDQTQPTADHVLSARHAALLGTRIDLVQCHRWHAHRNERASDLAAGTTVGNAVVGQEIAGHDWGPFLAWHAPIIPKRDTMC